MKAYPKTILTLIFIVSIDLICVAQGNPSTAPPQPAPAQVPPPGLPVDGGLFACFVIGSLLGIRALYKGLKRN